MRLVAHPEPGGELLHPTVLDKLVFQLVRSSLRKNGCGTAMKHALALFCLLTVGSLAMAQAAPPPAPAPSPSAAPPQVGSSNILPALDRLQSAASQANLDIAHMRIEKWKADAASKQQAQGNSDSLQRNLTSALPGLIANFRAMPQDLGAGFKLYRNLNALYDVLASFTEAAGAFGPKNDYEALAQQVSVIDSTRRDLADNLERLTASTEAELNQLRTQVRTMQQAAAAAPPKKVVVDDNEPAKKKAPRKKKPATTPPSNADGSASGTGAPPSAKSQ